MTSTTPPTSTAASTAATPADAPRPAASADERLVVIGAGTMGQGIAEVAAVAGYRTTLCDVDTGHLERAHRRIEASLAEAVARGKVDAAAREAALARLATAHAADAVATADIVIEAVPERLELKQEVFAHLSRLAPAHALLASNTSSLSIDAIAGSTTRADIVLGLHFFNPVPKMKLVEVVRGERTSEAALARALVLVRRLDKEPIVVRDAPGFASSRLGIALALEAIRMVEQRVASPADIDKAMELGYRHPMGPLALTDLVGLDVRLAIAESLHGELGEVFRPPALLRRMVADGKLGRKSGEGFYRYGADGKPTA